jgi:folate-binding protein YgfZ
MTQRSPADDVAAEYHAVRTGVGLLDRSDHGVVEVTGRDRAAFLHAMLTNDVKSLGAGRGCGAALLDTHGKVQVLLRVWVLEDRILVVTPPGMGDDTVQALDAFLFSEKAELRDATGELTLLLLAGPGTPELVERMAGVWPGGEAWSNAAGRVGDAAVRVVRGASESGEPDAWIAVSAAEGVRVRQALVDAGARPVSAHAWEPLRIEGGTPVFGRDVDATTLLPEIPIEALVSHTKGCYLGQEVVVRIRDRGHVNRHLRGLLLDGERVPPAGAAVQAAEDDIGRVTSAAWSPGLKRPVAFAYVRRQHAEPGTAVTVIGADGPVAGAVSALPIPR